MRARQVCHVPFSNITFWKSTGPQIITDVKSTKNIVKANSVFIRLLKIILYPLCLVFTFRNGILFGQDV